MHPATPKNRNTGGNGLRRQWHTAFLTQEISSKHIVSRAAVAAAPDMPSPSSWYASCPPSGLVDDGGDSDGNSMRLGATEQNPSTSTIPSTAHLDAGASPLTPVTTDSLPRNFAGTPTGSIAGDSEGMNTPAAAGGNFISADLPASMHHHHRQPSSPTSTSSENSRTSEELQHDELAVGDDGSMAGPASPVTHHLSPSLSHDLDRHHTLQPYMTPSATTILTTDTSASSSSSSSTPDSFSPSPTTTVTQNRPIATPALTANSSAPSAPVAVALSPAPHHHGQVPSPTLSPSNSASVPQSLLSFLSMPSSPSPISVLLGGAGSGAGASGGGHQLPPLGMPPLGMPSPARPQALSPTSSASSSSFISNAVGPSDAAPPPQPTPSPPSSLPSSAQAQAASEHQTKHYFSSRSTHSAPAPSSSAARSVATSPACLAPASAAALIRSAASSPCVSTVPLPSPARHAGAATRSRQPSLTAAELAALSPPLPAELDSLAGFVTTFDRLAPQTQSVLLAYLLRRLPSHSLQLFSSLVLPTLKRDFLALLPLELSHQILEHLDLRALSRCSSVSKSWHRVVDGEQGVGDMMVWKKMLLKDGWFDEDEVSKWVRRRSFDTSLVRSSLDGKQLGDWCAQAPSVVLNPTRASSTTTLMEEDGYNSPPVVVNEDGRQWELGRLGEEGEMSPLVKIPPGLYKKLYRKHFITKQNWIHGRHKTVSFPGHGSSVVTCLQFDDDKIVSGSDDMSIHIYDTNTGQLRRKLVGHEGGVWALQYWNQALVSGSTDRTVRVWDMETGRCTHLFNGHTSTVRCLLIVPPAPSYDDPDRLDPQEPLIVTGSRDATLRVWRLPMPGVDASYSPDATAVAANGAAANEHANPFFRHVLTGHTNSVRAIAGHGRVLVSGSYDSTVRVWDLVTGESTFCFRGHREKVYSVGYCHELQRAVSGSMDATVRVWCTRTGVSLFNLEGHSSLVGLLELSPSYLISAAADSTLRIWSPTTGQCLATLTGHSAAITCFHHDPNLNRIVSGSDGGVKAWELSSCPQPAQHPHPRSSNPSATVRTTPPPLNIASVLALPSSSHGGANTGPGYAFTQGPNGPQPVHGRFVRDLVSQIMGVWRVRMDERRMVSALQREGGKTWFEVFDFGEGVGEFGGVVEGVGDSRWAEEDEGEGDGDGEGAEGEGEIDGEDAEIMGDGDDGEEGGENFEEDGWEDVEDEEEVDMEEDVGGVVMEDMGGVIDGLDDRGFRAPSEGGRCRDGRASRGFADDAADSVTSRYESGGGLIRELTALLANSSLGSGKDGAGAAPSSVVGDDALVSELFKGHSDGSWEERDEHIASASSSSGSQRHFVEAASYPTTTSRYFAPSGVGWPGVTSYPNMDRPDGFNGSSSSSDLGCKFDYGDFGRAVNMPQRRSTGSRGTMPFATVPASRIAVSRQGKVGREGELE